MVCGVAQDLCFKIPSAHKPEETRSGAPTSTQKARRHFFQSQFLVLHLQERSINSNFLKALFVFSL